MFVDVHVISMSATSNSVASQLFSYLFFVQQGYSFDFSYK